MDTPATELEGLAPHAVPFADRKVPLRYATYDDSGIEAVYAALCAYETGVAVQDGVSVLWARKQQVNRTRRRPTV